MNVLLSRRISLGTLGRDRPYDWADWDGLLCGYPIPCPIQLVPSSRQRPQGRGDQRDANGKLRARQDRNRNFDTSSFSDGIDSTPVGQVDRLEMNPVQRFLKFVRKQEQKIDGVDFETIADTKLGLAQTKQAAEYANQWADILEKLAQEMREKLKEQ